MTSDLSKRLREDVARIVNGAAFRSHAAMLAFCLRTGDSEADARRYADDTHKPDMDAALTKADEILSLVANHIDTLEGEEQGRSRAMMGGSPAQEPVKSDGHCKSDEACHWRSVAELRGELLGQIERALGGPSLLHPTQRIWDLRKGRSSDGAISASPSVPQDEPALEGEGWRPIETARDGAAVECHGLDTAERVCFYEQDFYPLSNFSSFAIMWPLNAREGPGRFDTSEALYHWLKFSGQAQPKRVPTTYQLTIASAIRAAPSAHEAFKIAERHRSHRRLDWDEIKVGVMKEIIRAKAEQHEYVRRKLLATGDRELVENSWRDDFWGWGPNRDGQNMLGRLWMEVRAELLAAAPPVSAPPVSGEGDGA